MVTAIGYETHMTAPQGLEDGVVVWPLRSGSTGNCLLVGCGRDVILVDAGWRSQGAFRLVLEKIGVKPHHIAGILVTHTHSDHINYTTYRFAEKHGIPLYLHTRNWEKAYKLHYKGRLKGDPAWRGEKRKASAPKRAMSKRGPTAAIISIAQHASPIGMGQREFLRPQLMKSWILVVKALWASSAGSSGRSLSTSRSSGLDTGSPPATAPE